MSTAVNSAAEFSTDYLRVYYGNSLSLRLSCTHSIDRLFPYDQMFKWLSYGNDSTSDNPGVERDFFSRREFSFTIEDDIYIRYQSFRDRSEMTEAIKKRQPHKIDIGAIFSLPPKEHNTVASESFKTVERELVFDIDMTDYDDVRTCCTGADICGKCWPFMTMAIKVIDQILRLDFGYQHILWVYSGRRGVHCWVCDRSARELPNEARAAVVEYMSVKITDSETPLRKDMPIHPLISRAYQVLEPYFECHIADSAEGQGLLEDRDSCIRILNTLPNEAVRKELYDQWQRNELSGAEKWRQVIAATTTPLDREKIATAAKKKIKFSDLERWRMSLVLKYCYPRLDANVSKAQNHLLKSPFCVHPKTGRVCVPIDPTVAESFDPFQVPTVRILDRQINSFTQADDQDGEGADDIEKTAMKEYLECFERTFMKGLWTSIR
jgi:DNA primase small subunit